MMVIFVVVSPVFAESSGFQISRLYPSTPSSLVLALQCCDYGTCFSEAVSYCFRSHCISASATTCIACRMFSFSSLFPSMAAVVLCTKTVVYLAFSEWITAWSSLSPHTFLYLSLRLCLKWCNQLFDALRSGIFCLAATYVVCQLGCFWVMSAAAIPTVHLSIHYWPQPSQPPATAVIVKPVSEALKTLFAIFNTR